MYKSISYLIIISFFFLHSCSPKVLTTSNVSLSPLDYSKEVKVIDLYHIAPENSIIIGQVKIGDSGFSTNCDFDIVVELAKLEARKIGGNAINITSHIYPSFFGSSCHIISANILLIDDIENLDLDKLTARPSYLPEVRQLKEFDIIIRKDEKKVKCIITDEDDNNVYFNILVNNEKVKTQLARDQILSIVYSKNHFK